MNDSQINEMKIGLAVNAALSIYAANRDKMTVEEAVAEGKAFVNALDLNALITQISAGI